MPAGSGSPFWRWQGRFPDEEGDIAPAVIAHLASQVGVRAESVESYAFAVRSGPRHRRLVLDHLALGIFDEAVESVFRSWLLSGMPQREPTPSALDDEITGWFAARRVARLGSYRLDRLIRSVRAGHDDAVLVTVAQRLDDVVRSRLDGLLAGDGAGAAYTRLSADPGKPGLGSLLAEIAKLELVRGLGFALANRAYDLQLIQDYLGHRDPKHIVRYTRIAGRRFEGLWR